MILLISRESPVLLCFFFSCFKAAPCDRRILSTPVTFTGENNTHRRHSDQSHPHEKIQTSSWNYSLAAFRGNKAHPALFHCRRRPCPNVVYQVMFIQKLADSVVLMPQLSYSFFFIRWWDKERMHATSIKSQWLPETLTFSDIKERFLKHHNSSLSFFFGCCC